MSTAATWATLALWATIGILAILRWGNLEFSRAWRIVLVSLATTLSIAHQLMFTTVMEDSYITFRYSMNLAEGNGPVFNAGEHVEGYSNFLWMLLSAIPHALFGRGTVVFAAVLGACLAAACVPVAYLLTTRILRSAGVQRAQRLGIAAAILVAGATGLAAYGPSGLETPLFVFLALVVCHAVVSRRFAVAGVLGALLTMTRPDGVVIAGVAGLWLLTGYLWKRISHRPFLIYAGTALSLFVPWMVWRLWYYGGYLLPNAAAAKTGYAFAWQLKTGWNYFLDFSLAHVALIIFAVFGAVILCTRRTPAPDSDPAVRQARAVPSLLYTMALCYGGFVLYSGGDWMPAWRFLAVVPPLLAVATVATAGIHSGARVIPSVRSRIPDVGRRWLPVATLVIAGLSVVVSATDPQTLTFMHVQRDEARDRAEVGSWIGDRLPEGTVVSTMGNGAFSYRAGPQLVVVDALGLTDEHIARAGLRTAAPGFAAVSSDWDYVVDIRRPALIRLEGYFFEDAQPCRPPSPAPPWFPLDNPNFLMKYQLATFQHADTGQWVAVYLRRDTAAQLVGLLDADPRFSYVPCSVA